MRTPERREELNFESTVLIDDFLPEELVETMLGETMNRPQTRRSAELLDLPPELRKNSPSNPSNGSGMMPDGVE
jgi:hypothetical protein